MTLDRRPFGPYLWDMSSKRTPKPTPDAIQALLAAAVARRDAAPAGYHPRGYDTSTSRRVIPFVTPCLGCGKPTTGTSCTDCRITPASK